MRLTTSAWQRLCESWPSIFGGAMMTSLSKKIGVSIDGRALFRRDLVCKNVSFAM